MHNMFILLCKEVAHRMFVLQTGIILQILVRITITVKSEEQLEKKKYHRLVSWNKNIL